MATPTKRRRENVDGDFYVDSTCIDCDTCRWMAPTVFARRGSKSAVVRQPSGPDDRRSALQALVSCPTASIGTVKKAADLAPVARSFPVPVTDDVFHCGYHAESSFGATSYLIRRPAGNVLVDSPRFAGPLVKRLEELGGVRYMFLTHRDDVADHDKFHERFGCQRILHADDVTRATQDVEIQPEGTDDLELAPDLRVIPVPGHTRGHSVLLYRDTFLFTGDHLAYDDESGALEAWPDVCWYSWPKQTESMRRLRRYRFEWVLPGHGRRYHASAEWMRQDVERLATWMSTAA